MIAEKRNLFFSFISAEFEIVCTTFSVLAERVAAPGERRMGERRKLGERVRPSSFSSGVVAIAVECCHYPNSAKQTSSD